MQNINNPKIENISKFNDIKVLSLVCLANMCELYDFTLFGVLMPILVTQFFPIGDHSSNMIIAYTGFALSFLILPFGSIIWGYIGDKFGSHKIFKASLLFMAFPSLLIAILPTFDQIGWYSAILLILFRLIQGLSASGEILGSKIYAFDHLKQKKYFIASGLISGFGAIGVLGSISVGGYISASNFTYWRLAFGIGGFSILILVLLRMLIIVPKPQTSMKVTNVFSSFKIIKENPLVAIQGFALSAVLGILSYYMHSYLISFQIINLKYNFIDTYQNSKICILSTVIFATIAAFTLKFDVMNIKNYVSKILTIGVVLILPANLMILQKDPTIIKFCFAIIGGYLGLFATISGVYIITSFSHYQRCRGALLVNALGVAIFGGLTPLTMTLLAKISLYLPTFALWSSLVICYIVVKYAKEPLPSLPRHR